MGSSIPDLPNDLPTSKNAGNHSTSFKRRLLTVIRFVIAASVLIAIVITIRNSAAQFADLDFVFSEIDFSRIALSVCCYLLSMLLSCVFWNIALRALGCSAPWQRVLQAFFLSQLGKYVPGKAMVVIIRTDLIRDVNVDTIAAAASVFVETLTWIFVGSVIACVLIFVEFPDQSVLKWTAFALAAVAGMLTWPPVFQRISSIFTKNQTQFFTGIKLRVISSGWAILTFGWCLNALSLYLIISGLPDTNICWEDFSLTLACVSLATVAGFASLLPGGLGVRELVMLPLLSPRFGVATALIAAVLIRIVWISAELLSSGIIFMSLRISGKYKLEDKCQHRR